MYTYPGLKIYAIHISALVVYKMVLDTNYIYTTQGQF